MMAQNAPGMHVHDVRTGRPMTRRALEGMNEDDAHEWNTRTEIRGTALTVLNMVRKAQVAVAVVSETRRMQDEVECARWLWAQEGYGSRMAPGVPSDGAGATGGVEVIWDKRRLRERDWEVIVPGRILRVALEVKGAAETTVVNVYGVYMPDKGKTVTETRQTWDTLIKRAAQGTMSRRG